MPPLGDLHMFSNAKNPVILGGTFTNVTSSSSKRYGLQILLENIATGAFHNAAERGDPPRCHPHTRKAIRAEIMEWIKAPNSMRKLILWIHGPAGAGKTAIAQSIAEECEREGLLAASFFFSRTAAGCNDTTRFIATLAYQLSRSIPQIENNLFTAIEKDPTIFSRSLSTQIRVLVIEPLIKAVPPSLRPIFLLVDGMDECGPDFRSQADILNVLATAMAELQHIPFIILLASRPEYEIREAFLGDHLRPLVKRLVLDHNYMPDEDIRLFFNDVFQKIHDKHLRLGSRLPSPWPGQSDVDLLVSKASGQFIFAATVTKFIDSPRFSPADRLNIILGLSSAGNETPFALLDALYRYILASVADARKVLEVLRLLLLSDKYSSDLTVDLVEELLGFDVRRVLIDMHALVFVPPPVMERSHKSGHRHVRSRGLDSVLRIHHASLYDFLIDPSRSLEYHIDTNQGHNRLCRHWLRVISSRPMSRHSQYTYLSLPISAFIYHHENSEPTKEIADSLAHLNLRAGLEGISNLDVDLYRPDWAAFFECIKQQGGDRDDIFPRLQGEFDSFILDTISQYPSPFRSFVPILLQVFVPDHASTDIFDILLHAVYESAKELDDLRMLDELLLGIVEAVYDDEGKTFIMNLLQDKSRAGKYVIDGSSYVALAKAIVGVMCRKPGEIYQISFEKIDTEDEFYTGELETRIQLLDPKLSWFPNILENASTDLDLARLLLECALQYRRNDEPWFSEPFPGRRTIAEASIKYIQRCGVPFLEHKHKNQPHIDECIICNVFPGASVVENINTPAFPPALLSEFDGDVFDNLPEVNDNMLDVAAYSLGPNDTDILPEIPGGSLPCLRPDSEPFPSAISDTDKATSSFFSRFGFTALGRPFYLLVSPSSYIDIFL